MAVNILLRRGTAAEWTASNPILLEGEVGVETDSKKLKVGDGLTVWASLPYITLTPAAAAALYAPLANPTFTGTVSGVTKSMVGLGSVDNTSDANKPVSTAQQTALDLKAPLANPTFTGTVSGVTKSMVGLGNVDNTTDANKPVSTSTQTALDLKAPLASPTFTGSVSFDTGVALIFEGATADGFETTLAVADPTADRSLTLPNATGTLATQEHVASEIGTHVSDTTSVHGIADTADLATKSYADTAASNAVATSLGTHEADTLSVHGIADTSLLVTTTGTQTLTNKTITTPTGLTKNDVGLSNVDNTSDANKPVSTATQTALDLKASISAIAELAQDAVNTAVVAGVGLDKVYDDESNTITLDIDSTVATKTYADGAVSTHSSDTTSVHGITDTAELATKAYADSAVSTHTSDTTSVHGITDTSLLVTTTASQTLTNKTITTPLGLVKSDVGLGNVDNTADASKPVSTAQQTALDLKANLSGPTFTGTVSGITKSMVGLGNVDNTTDASKPVSTAQQTALDLKANLSGATFTGAISGTSLTLSGDLTVNGTTTTLNSTTMSVDDKNIELGSVASPSDVTADGGGITLKGTTDKTFNWVDATDSWTSSEHINLASGKDLKVNGTAVISSTAGGFIFTDGTQTKEGTPSRTPIIQKTDSYTLSALTERDSLIEVAKGSAATITIPLNSAVAFPVGTSIDILQTSTGQVTIAGAAGVTVNSTPGLKLRTQWSTATLFKRAENTWVVYGDLTA
jgi:hypothetical protein